MTKFNFNYPNIFITISINEHKLIVYSNMEGLIHLNKQLESNILQGLISEKQIFENMANILASQYSYNTYTPLKEAVWSFKNIVVHGAAEIENFDKVYQKWYKKLAYLVGEKNILEVRTNEFEWKMIKKLTNDNDIMSALESLRLKDHLIENLETKVKSVKKVKI